jgi:hypothetical protein
LKQRHTRLLDHALEHVADRRAVIGMNPVKRLAADQFTGGIPGESLDRVRDEANRAVAIEQRNGVCAVLDHHSVVALAVPRFVRLGDIQHGADEPARAALLADRAKGVPDPQRATVGCEDAVLDSIPGTLLDRAGAGGSHTGAVFGMDGVEPDESSCVRITFPDDRAKAVE